MSPENTKALIEIAGPIWPTNLNPRENLMCLGFFCDDGWFQILANCFTDLRKIREAGIAPNLILMQVKEKFGELRVYTAGDDEGDIVWAITSHYAHVSTQHCEVCSKYGITRNKGGWLKTLCKEHALEYKYLLTEREEKQDVSKQQPS